MIKRLAAWLFWETAIPLGPLSPWVLGLSIGRKPHRVKAEAQEGEGR